MTSARSQQKPPLNHFFEFLDLFPDAAFAVDRHGHVIAWNRAMVELTGIPAGDMLGKGNYEYALPFYGVRRPVLIDLVLNWDAAAATRYKYDRMSDGTLVSEVENLLVGKQLRRLWNTARKLYQADGSLIGAVEIVRDITQIRKAEEVHRRYDLMKEVGRDIVLFVNPEDGRIVEANDAAVEVYGYSRPELLSMTLSDLRTPKDRHLVEDQIAQARAIGILFETEHVKKDGSTFYVEVSSKGTVIDGTPVLISLVKNITERKMAEKALRENEARLTAIFARAAVGLCEISLQGKFMQVNDELCRILGRTRDQLLTMSVPDVTHPEDVSRSLEALRQLLDKDQSASLDKRYVRADGSIIFANSTLTRLDDKHGAPQAILAVTVDITARIKANEVLERQVAQRTAALKRRNIEIRDLAYRTIHAMENDRRILSMELHDSIGGTLTALVYQLQERLEQMAPQPPPEVFPFEKILEHLQDTIRETRYISKRLRPSVLDDFGLAAAINDTVRDFIAFYPKIGISAEIDIDDSDLSDTITIVVYRVIQEALNNIARHSQADSVTIRLQKSQTHVHFTVRDNGIGFDYEKVFGNGAASTGYGLHSMKERVEICKGEFRVISKPGNGTVVDVSIPIYLLDQGG
jgi:two-component system, NarL family, sensor histidine kinase UhpB